MNGRKKIYGERIYKFVMDDGTESVALTEETLKVFPKFGKYIPRLVYNESLDEGMIDLRTFGQNQNGILYPEAGGIKINLETFQKMHKVMDKIKDFLIKNDLWQEGDI